MISKEGHGPTRHNSCQIAENEYSRNKIDHKLAIQIAAEELNFDESGKKGSILNLREKFVNSRILNKSGHELIIKESSDNTRGAHGIF